MKNRDLVTPLVSSLLLLLGLMLLTVLGELAVGMVPVTGKAVAVVELIILGAAALVLIALVVYIWIDSLRQ